MVYIWDAQEAAIYQLEELHDVEEREKRERTKQIATMEPLCADLNKAIKVAAWLLEWFIHLLTD